MNLKNVSLNLRLVLEGSLEVSWKWKESGKAVARNSVVKVKL